MATSRSTGSAATESAQRTAAAAADGRYPWIAMGVVLIGTFMVILDTTIVNVALPQIGFELHSSDGIEWVVTAYLLAVALSTPASGWLADRFGRRRVFIVSLGCFAGGSLLAALAPTLPLLVAFRVLQGLGGGATMPVGMALIYELFPPDRRGHALGIWGVAAMAAPALGPVLGGLIATSVSWRWLFLVNVPIGAVGVVASTRLLRDTGYRERRRFDASGLALCGGGLVAVLLGLSEAPSWGWASAPTISLLTAGAALLVIFVAHELRVDQPLLEVRMFRVGTFALTMGIVALVTVMQFGRLVFIPLELQTVRDDTALRVGVLMTPAALGAALTMPIGGRLADRIGARTPVLMGTAILTVAAGLLAQLTPDTPGLAIAAALLIGGLGTGLAIMPNTVAGMNSLPGRFVAQASAVRTMTRQVAGAFAVAVLATIVASAAGSVMGDAAPGSAAAADAQSAYNTVFVVAAAATAAAFLLAWRLPGRDQTRATQAERAREAEEAALA